MENNCCYRCLRFSYDYLCCARQNALQNAETTPRSITTDPMERDNPNLDKLIKYINDLLERVVTDERRSPPPIWVWPASSSFCKLKEFLSEGINVVKDIMPEAKTVVRGFLQGMGTAHLATAGLLAVANILERFETVSQNRDECLLILKETIRLARDVKDLKERAHLGEEMEELVREATELIMQGCMMCGTQMDASKFSRFFKTFVNQEELRKFRLQLESTYMHINTRINISKIHRKPFLRRSYPQDAVAIEESAKAVLGLLEWENPKKSIAIILEGPEGIGKSILADAVFARVNRTGLKYSKVQLFDKANSQLRAIEELQKQILQDLNGLEELPEIRTNENGQDEIGRVLENVEAIIYIDHVLGANGLRLLLPTNMKNAKKVRLLLTTRDGHVCRACRVEKRSFYLVQQLPPEPAMDLLKKELGLEGQINSSVQLTDDQLRNIVEKCGRIPWRLRLAAENMLWEEDKQIAYDRVMQGQLW